MRFLYITMLACFITNGLSSQVLDTSNQEVQAALSNAQVEGSPLANFFQKRTPMMDILFALVKDDDGIESHYVGAEVGSAYVDDIFQPGKVFYNQEELGDVYYRLNAYNNEIELKKTLSEEEKQLALVKNEEIKIVTKKEELLFRTFKNLNGKVEDGYLSLFHNGPNYIIYKRIFKKFSEPRPAANSMVNPIPSRFTDYIAYYYQKIDDAEIKEIPLKTNKFLKAITNTNNQAIKAFIKTNSLDLSNEKDLILIFDFLSSEQS